MSSLTKQSKQYLASRVSEVQRTLDSIHRTLRQSENILREVIDTIDPTYARPVDFVRCYQDAVYESSKRWNR